MFAAFDSPADLMIVLVVVVLLFGGSQLPKLARNLGKAQKEFRDALSESQRGTASADTKSDEAG